MNHHPMQPCWDLAAAAVQAEAIDCALALGLFAAQRLEMYLRGKRMLEAAR